jgi:hypothetical protein
MAKVPIRKILKSPIRHPELKPEWLEGIKAFHAQMKDVFDGTPEEVFDGFRSDINRAKIQP